MEQPYLNQFIDEFYTRIEEERGNIMSETKKGSTFIKHYYSQTFEGEPHYTAEITVDEDANLSEMCRAFELFLKVSGYEFHGVVDIVKDEEEPDPLIAEMVKRQVKRENDLMSVFDEKM